ncbi:MAG: polysaccharide export outer membrane protein [Patiriisocius sp.]|jgi:polysaccharide export outer membrane protein
MIYTQRAQSVTSSLQFVFIICICSLLLSSCGVNRDLMFKTPTNFEFNELLERNSTEYNISPNDMLRFRLFTNDGFVLIDLTAGDEGSGGSSSIYRESTVSYIVENDGLVKLPTLGRVNLTGMSIRESQLYLEYQYSQFYRKPFVILEVINKRAIVSTGSGGTARVIDLENNNITLIEALALAGGIDDRGNSSKIKVIRNGISDKEVYHVDLSTIEGIQMGDMIIQANDIIYVEPVPRLASELLQDVAPIVSLLTSGFVILNFLSTK